MGIYLYSLTNNELEFSIPHKALPCAVLKLFQALCGIEIISCLLLLNLCS